MESTMMYIGAISFCLALFAFIFSVVYFGLHRKKYEKLISLYRQEGLPLSAQNNLMSFFGYWGCIFLVIFFKRVLDGKPVNIAPKQSTPPEVYTFVLSQPKELTAWIRTYYYVYMTCYALFVMGCSILFFGKWMGWH